ncbi:hypothetical protein AVEN_242105-1 [Araneus ventricosus]|uniref:Uncharacterized protein n=1 Tax=Araneus ventricosus TaxID=182803 RepID=A0A4Y2ADA7_ARAVE|nr:hypothetical protein AVEN_242105-1 [Araneus ventricosus]
MLYSKASSSDKEEELISASASDSRDCKTVCSNGGRTAIGLEAGGGLISAGESSKSSDMLYSKASSSDKEEESSRHPHQIPEIVKLVVLTAVQPP